MKNLLYATLFAASMAFTGFASTSQAGPQALTDQDLAQVKGGAELAICCAECHGHPDGSIHCTGCRFCIVVQVEPQQSTAI